jgi:hypothetical protein
LVGDTISEDLFGWHAGSFPVVACVAAFVVLVAGGVDGRDAGAQRDVMGDHGIAPLISPGCYPRWVVRFCAPRLWLVVVRSVGGVGGRGPYTADAALTCL